MYDAPRTERGFKMKTHNYAAILGAVPTKPLEIGEAKKYIFFDAPPKLYGLPEGKRRAGVTEKVRILLTFMRTASAPMSAIEYTERAGSFANKSDMRVHLQRLVEAHQVEYYTLGRTRFYYLAGRTFSNKTKEI